MPFGTKDFKAHEFRCKCQYCLKSKPHKVTQEAAERLQELRDKVGRPLAVSSAYRCERHPSEANKKAPGQHNKGTAFDVIVRDGAEAYQIQKIAFELGFSGIAFGNGFVHIDVRKTTPVCWRY